MNTVRTDRRATVNQLDATEARWFAVYTNVKREKLVKQRLEAKGVECYLPLLSYTRRYSRKLKHIRRPLISCYIFTRIVKEQYVPVLQTEDVRHFINFSRQLISIPESEIDTLRLIVGEGIPVELEQHDRFKPGTSVEIIGGQLTGLCGKIVERKGNRRFVVELETLGFDLLMEVDPAYLHLPTPMTGSCPVG